MDWSTLSSGMKREDNVCARFCAWIGSKILIWVCFNQSVFSMLPFSLLLMLAAQSFIMIGSLTRQSFILKNVTGVEGLISSVKQICPLWVEICSEPLLYLKSNWHSLLNFECRFTSKYSSIPTFIFVRSETKERYPKSLHLSFLFSLSKPYVTVSV